MTTTFVPSGEIRGLTDRPRLPRLGKIRLGVKKLSSGGKEYPSAVDYFVCPPEVQAIYGEKPRELDIVFPIDDVSRIASVAYKKYSATRGKVCTSDGEIAIRIVDTDKLAGIDGPTQQDLDAALAGPDTKKWERLEIPCPAGDCRFFLEGTCKPVMNLQFLLPSVPGLGIWQLDTGSLNSIVDVRGGIQLVKKISGGRLAGIPLKLRVEPTTAYPDGKKKTVFTLKLFSPEKLEVIAAIGTKSLHDILLPLPEGEVPEPSELEAELYPESLTQTTREVEGVTLTRGGEVVHLPKREPVVDVPVAPAAAAPITTIGPDASTEFAIAAEIEALFAKLELDPKQRDLWRNYYKGRAPALRDFLKKQLERKNGSGGEKQ